jgi:hypothetical protein
MYVIPQTPRAYGGFRPLGPLPGLCPGPAGEPTHAPPNPKSWIRPCYRTEIRKEESKRKHEERDKRGGGAKPHISSGGLRNYIHLFERQF